MFSTRFGKEIVITAHAEARLRDRNLSQDQLFSIIEHGTIHKKDEKRMWISREIAARRDNLICAAIVVEDRLVIKTVMGTSKNSIKTRGQGGKARKSAVYTEYMSILSVFPTQPSWL